MGNEEEALRELLRATVHDPEIPIIVDELHRGVRRRRTLARLAPAIGVVSILGVVGAVSWATGQPFGPSDGTPDVATPEPTKPTQSPKADPGCPETEPYPNGGAAIIDWVDFIQLYGRTYTSSNMQPSKPSGPPATKSDLGDEIARVTCSISELTAAHDREVVGGFLDGNASYLAKGTPIYQVKGYDPECRVAAIVDDEIREYLAQHEVDGQSTPMPCALNPKVSPSKITR
jgi:hypothetical protein